MAGRVLPWAESVILFLALYLGLPATGLLLDTVLGWPSLPAVLRGAGAIPLILGAVDIVWCFALFVRRGHGTPNPLVPPDALVTSGPFAWTRNPIILGHALATGGLGLVLGSPAAVLLVLLLGIPVQFIARYEERSLEARFGDAYRVYRSTVPRWIPRRPRQMR